MSVCLSGFLCVSTYVCVVFFFFLQFFGEGGISDWEKVLLKSTHYKICVTNVTNCITQVTFYGK